VCSSGVLIVQQVLACAHSGMHDEYILHAASVDVLSLAITMLCSNAYYKRVACGSLCTRYCVQ
jgi:hypothetical protein